MCKLTSSLGELKNSNKAVRKKLFADNGTTLYWSPTTNYSKIKVISISNNYAGANVYYLDNGTLNTLEVGEVFDNPTDNPVLIRNDSSMCVLELFN